jgi:DNA polymerase-3 subunit gamma/tau
VNSTPSPSSTETASAVPPVGNGAYLVLARKYRPQRFADLTGQEHVVRTLANALKTGRVAHAFLFTGPRGCGKTTSARILARALSCVGPDGKKDKPGGEPCGVCTPCIEIAAGNDVDVQEIDAASNNGVDDVRALREAARYLPARDRYKIYIVDEVHMLSSAAFNALLKTLEEPPGHIKFLLATTDPQKLPATILSRVQRHNFQLVPLGKIVTRLREIAVSERIAVSDGALSLVARQAMGSMRDALSLLDQLFSAHDPALGEVTDQEAAETLGALDRRIVSEAVGAVLRRDAAGALQAVVRAYESGAEFKRLAEDLAAHARNLVLATMPGVRQDLPDHELRELAQEAAQHEPAHLARVFELLQTAQDEVAQAATPRHALEVALLRAVHLAPSGALPDLIARVESLAGKLGLQAPPPASPAAKKAPVSPWVSRGLPDPGAPLRVTQPAGGEADDAPAALPEPVASATIAAATVATATNEPAGRPAPSAPPPALSAPAPFAAPPRPAPVSAPPPVFSRPAPPPEPAAPAPAPAAISASASLIASLPLDQSWKLLLESVRAARKNALAAVLEHAVPLEISGAGVVLGLPRAQTRHGMLADRDNRAALESAFERVLGMKVPLVIKDHEPAPTAAGEAASALRSVAEQKLQARSQAAASRLGMGREHPNVKAALEVLGGEIEDVKDLGEE